jgi:hypothetical protein
MKAMLYSTVLAAGCLTLSACHHPPHEAQLGPPYDRPFPLGQVSDSHWETQQTNAEAMDFIFYDHEFVGSTEKLTPLGKKHLLQVALRLEHVPFPVVVEESPEGRNPELDQRRRAAVINELNKLGLQAIEQRVVVAPALTQGLSAVEGEAAYYQTLQGGFTGGAGRRFGGTGGFFR